MSEADLARRLARLEAIEEIKQLQARYCAYCDDDYNPDGIANLFIEKGSASIRLTTPRASTRPPPWPSTPRSNR